MIAKQKQVQYVDDKERKNHQQLKDHVLKKVKVLFESMDNINPEMVTNSAVDIANIAFFISEGLGKVDVFGNKIINYGGK